MRKLLLSDDVKLGIVALMPMLVTGFLAFQPLGEKLPKLFEAFGLLIIVIFLLGYSNVFFRPGLKFKIPTLLFFLLPLLGVVGAYLFHDQPINLSLTLFRENFFWLFYFVLHVFNIPKERIIKLIMFIGCVWAFLTIVQQFTYPHAYFYTRGEGNVGLRRSDVLRFSIPGHQFGAFALFYGFYGYLTTKNIRLAWIAGLNLLGFYFFGYRGFAAAAIGCMGLGLFMTRGIAKWGYLLLFFLLGGFILTLWQPKMLMHMVEMTTEQVNSDDYIRFLAVRFFLYEYWPHWTAKLLGNGPFHQDSAYGQEMNYINTVLSYYRSDVGIIGTYSTYGFFYIVNIVWVNIKGLTLKIPAYEDKYLKLLFWYPAVLLPLAVDYNNSQGMVFYCLIYYLFDKMLEKKEVNLVQPVRSRQLANATA